MCDPLPQDIYKSASKHEFMIASAKNNCNQGCKIQHDNLICELRHTLLHMLKTSFLLHYTLASRAQMETLTKSEIANIGQEWNDASPLSLTYTVSCIRNCPALRREDLQKHACQLCHCWVGHPQEAQELAALRFPNGPVSLAAAGKTRESPVIDLQLCCQSPPGTCPNLQMSMSYTSSNINPRHTLVL